MRAAAPDGAGRDPMAKRETSKLVNSYYEINDPRVRKRVFELAKAIAASADAGEGTKRRARRRA